MYKLARIFSLFFFVLNCITVQVLEQSKCVKGGRNAWRKCAHILNICLEKSCNILFCRVWRGNLSFIFSVCLCNVIGTQKRRSSRLRLSFTVAAVQGCYESQITSLKLNILKIWKFLHWNFGSNFEYLWFFKFITIARMVVESFQKIGSNL